MANRMRGEDQKEPCEVCGQLFRYPNKHLARSACGPIPEERRRAAIPPRPPAPPIPPRPVLPTRADSYTARMDGIVSWLTSAKKHERAGRLEIADHHLLSAARLMRETATLVTAEVRERR